MFLYMEQVLSRELAVDAMGEFMISEDQIKLLCKLAVEYGNRPFSRNEKEMLKEAIDQSSNWEELLAVAITSFSLGND